MRYPPAIGVRIVTPSPSRSTVEPAAGLLGDVEILQDGLALHLDVEDALAGPQVVGLGEDQLDGEAARGAALVAQADRDLADALEARRRDPVVRPRDGGGVVAEEYG